MGEGEWLAGGDPRAMLDRLAWSRGRARRERKLWLFAAAWWRTMHSCTRGQEEIAAEHELTGKYDLLRACLSPWREHPDHFARGAALLREVVGNPFRAATLTRASLTPAALAIAGEAYETRDFTALLPILADCLEDAGCDDGAILSHLRSPGPHVRGCWATDIILGNS